MESIIGLTNLMGMNKTPSSTTKGFKLTSEDFMKILLAEMSQPNINNIFATGTQGTGGASAFSSTLSSMLAMGNLFNYQSGFSSVSELPLLSLLIGKHVKALDSNNNEVSGIVQRVLMQNGVAMIDIGDSKIVEPSTIKEVK